MDNTRKLVPGDIYRHFKNKLYQIITVAVHSETGEQYVVYQALYGDFKTYIRPYGMFMSEVDHVKYPDVLQKYRFEKVDVPEPLKTDEPSVQKTVIDQEDTADICTVHEGVNPYLLEFFDKETSADKIEYLNSIKNKIDDRLINDISASMDITVDEGDLDIRFASLISCLQTMARFECGRLR